MSWPAYAPVPFHSASAACVADAFATASDVAFASTFA